MNNIQKNITVAIIGLGYIGLTLALAVQKKYKVIGLDCSQSRIDELKNEHDIYAIHDNVKLKNIHLTTNVDHIKQATIYIITVQTGLDKNNKPDLSPLINACKNLSNILKKNDTVILESTIAPGTSRKLAFPILQKNLAANDFYFGYSPEKINPTDKKHILNNTPKIVSGINKDSLCKISDFYQSIIEAPIHKVDSIEIAEASKILENIQRDVNIALMNEITQVFNAMNIDTKKVLKASQTKWNFIPFHPGFVGGHCIPVDPVYLIESAKKISVPTKLMNTARQINDSLPLYVKNNIQKLTGDLDNKKILVLGICYKKNFSDIRNSLVISLINLLKKNKADIQIYDPIIHKKSLDKAQLNYKLLQNIEISLKFDIIIYAVDHEIFNQEKINKFLCNNKKTAIFDLTNTLNNIKLNNQLFWQF